MNKTNYVDVTFSHQDDDVYEVMAVGHTFFLASNVVNGLGSIFNFRVGGRDETEIRMSKDNWDKFVSLVWYLTITPMTEQVQILQA